MVPNYDKSKSTLTNRDTELANYYLNWSNLESITTEEVEDLFNSFWQKYSAIDKVDMALTSLGLEQGADWSDVRQAYKKRIAINHPDKGGCAERFIETREAYEVLSFNYRKS